MVLPAKIFLVGINFIKALKLIYNIVSHCSDGTKSFKTFGAVFFWREIVDGNKKSMSEPLDNYPKSDYTTIVRFRIIIKEVV